MKTTTYRLFFLSISSLLILASCNGTKSESAHAHGSDSHTHDSPDYFGAYAISESEYGTKTVVTVSGDTRTMTTNALPNHTTGAFPNPGNPNTIKAQNRTHTFPMTPTYTGKSQWVREVGIALNGVKFEPETAEVVICESGEHYRIEAKQEHFDLGLDANNAHVQPTGEYHYHGTPSGMLSSFDTSEDLVHIGFAHDGFPIYYSQSQAYVPSFQLTDKARIGTDCNYSNPHQSTEVEIQRVQADGTFKSDWEYVSGLGSLDECNGIEVDGKYMYLITDTYPFVGRCLMGEFEGSQMHGPPPGQGLPRGGRPPRGSRPSGPPPPDRKNK